MIKNAKFISVPEAAKILKVSRIAVFKNVKKGKIPAIRIGRNWAIPANFKIFPTLNKVRLQKYHKKIKKAILGKKKLKMRQLGPEKIFQKINNTLNSMGWD